MATKKAIETAPKKATKAAAKSPAKSPVKAVAPDTAAKPAAKLTAKKIAATGESASPKTVAGKTATHEEIAALAHQFWVEGGRQHGAHQSDWQRAEEALKS